MANHNLCQVGTPDRLLELGAGRMEAAAAVQLERHVAGCAQCREFLASQRSVWQALDEWEQAAPPVSADFDRQLYARIAEEQQGNWWMRMWRRLTAAGEPVNWKPVVSMAACAVLVTGVMLRWDRAPEPKAAVTVAFEKHEIESLERALEDFEMLHDMGSPEQR